PPGQRSPVALSPYGWGPRGTQDANYRVQMRTNAIVRPRRSAIEGLEARRRGMKRVTFIAIALLVAVLAVLSSRVAAQETNVQEVTYLTFSNTVEMPGVSLPAGTYMFRLADTPSRNVVQVLDRDGKDIKGQWLFVQSERPEVSGDTVIMLKENRAGSTPAVQYWYFPGEKIGKEFIYPKDQAQKIAARTGQQVRTETGYVTSQSAEASN